MIKIRLFVDRFGSVKAWALLLFNLQGTDAEAGKSHALYHMLGMQIGSVARQ